MEPGTYNFDIYQGDTKRFYARVRQGATSETAVPVDLTDAVPKAQLRTTPENETILAEIACSLADAVNGLILLELTPAQTALLTVGAKVWDMQITFPNTDQFTYLKGTATVQAQVTRP